MELTQRPVNEERQNLGSKSPLQHPPKQDDLGDTMAQRQREDYDFAAHRRIPKPTNVLESIGHLIKGCLGGGILGIPEAYMKCGLWTAAVTTVLFGLYITYCVHILVTAAQELYVRLKISDMSYPDLAEKSVESGPFPKIKKYGRLFRYAVDLTICIDLFGSCCVYEIIIAKTIQQLVEQTHEDGPINMLRMYIIMLLVPILLLCMIRSLKYLAPFTLVADFFIVMCVIATIVYCLQVAPPINTVPSWKSFMGFFEFCGVVVFSMEGVGVSLPIENNMKEPKKFHIVLIGGMSVVVSFVLITGFFGYWGWAEKVRTPITLSFPDDWFPTILKALIGVMIYVTFALNFWAPFNLVWYYLKKRHLEEKHYIWERVYRAGFIIVITIIAVIFPNMGNLMGLIRYWSYLTTYNLQGGRWAENYFGFPSDPTWGHYHGPLIGSFCLSNMGFIFPAIIETLVMWDYPGLGIGKWRLWKNFIIIIMGLILLTSGSYTNGKALLGL